MNLYRISTVCHCLLVSSVIGVAIAASPARAAEKADSVIEAVAGKEFTLMLDANRTTGFAWQLAKPLDETVVKKTRNIYQEAANPAGGAAPRVGGGGKEAWTFKAVSPGNTVIEFKYVRPWEKDQAPAKTTRFQVVVKATAPK